MNQPLSALAHTEPPSWAQPAAAALACQGLTLRRGRGKTVLNDIHLALPEGAVLGLVGRNGAGKSSLIECLLGLVAPTQGQCQLLGEPALNLSDAVRERLGYVAQSPDLFGPLTGEGHLRRFGAAYAHFDERSAVALALRLDLPLCTPAAKLSAGDQQKLSLVLALAHDPDLLLLDEPVAALDPLTRREFMRSLFERRPAHQAPRTVLISSHLLSDLERVVTHVAFMRDGRLQLMDEWDALAEHMRLLERPVQGPPWPGRCLHRHTVFDAAGQARERLLFDARWPEAPRGEGRSLSLDDLFLELNSGGWADPHLAVATRPSGRQQERAA